MPSVHIQSWIPSEEYVKLKRKMEELRAKECEVVGIAVLLYLNEPEKTAEKKFARDIIEYVKVLAKEAKNFAIEDIKNTGKI